MTPEQQSDLDVSYCTIHDKNGVKLGWVWDISQACESLHKPASALYKHSQVLDCEIFHRITIKNTVL
jgi:hypothetical protein